MGLLGFFLSLLTNGKEEHLSPHLYVLSYCTAAVSGTKLKFHASLRNHPQGASIMMQCMRMQAVKSMRTYQTGHILGIKKPKLEMVPPDRAYACFSHTQGPDLVFVITGSRNGTFFMAVSLVLPIFIILQSDYAKDVAQPTLTSKRVFQADYYAHPENYNPVFHEKIAPLHLNQRNNHAQAKELQAAIKAVEMQRFEAMVKAVPSGDCLVLLPIKGGQVIIDPKFEKTVYLSQASAPELDKDEIFERDELFAWGSREFMRKLCIGKVVELYEQKYNFGTMIFGNVMLGEENVALRAISKGWAKVRESNDNKAKLEQEKAVENGLGRWNKAPDAAMESSRIRSELTIQSSLVKTTPMSGIAETVIDARTVRVLLIPHFHFIDVMVVGVQSYAKYGAWSEDIMEEKEKWELKNADYEAREGRSRVWKDYVPPPTALYRIQGQHLRGTVVQIVCGDHIIVADDSLKDGTEQYREVYLSSITCPKLGFAGVKREEAYANEAIEFVRAHLIGRQVRVELEYSRIPSPKSRIKYYHGSVFLVNDHGDAHDSQNVSELVVAEGLGTVCRQKDIELVSKYYDALRIAESDAIRNNKGMHSGMDPKVVDIKDLSNATLDQSGKACDYIFLWFFDGTNDKFEKVPAVVESIIRTNTRDKIILRIQNAKTWRIAFSLGGVTLPRYEEPYANEAISLLRKNILQRTVEVELETIDEDGCFVGTVLLSNIHVAIPLLEAGLAKLKVGVPTDYCKKLSRVEKSARTKKLKIWENYGSHLIATTNIKQT
ncbi:hypothetical protein ACE6H2_024994 [Prunus campanulata]